MLGHILFFVALGGTLTLGVWLVHEWLRDGDDPLGNRLEELQSYAMVSTTRTPRRKGSGAEGGGLVALVSAVPGGEDWARGSSRLLRQAGVRSKHALPTFLALALLFVALLCAGMIWLQRGNPISQVLMAMVAALILGFMLPKVVLQRMVKRYRQKLQEALPDTVDLLGIVLGTGLALDQSMMRVSEEMEYIYPELAAEFATVVMQVRAGQERAKAFDMFVRRTGLEDIKALAGMIVQSEKFGTSLAGALKVHAESMRQARRLRAEAAIAKAGIKMLFPIVLFILPVLFIITLVPGMLSVLRDLNLLGGGK